MYGYVKIDKSTLSAIETENYYAHFCGLCVFSGKKHGQLSRLLVSFDTAFLDIFVRSLVGNEAEKTEKKCIANRKKPRKIIHAFHLSERILDASILLSYLKLTDDILDKKSFKRRLLRGSIRKAYIKSKRRHRALEGQLRALYDELRVMEANYTSNLDQISHYFAHMLEVILEFVLKGENVSEEQLAYSKKLFYALGKWIYITDAIDDIKEDKKQNCFNPIATENDLADARFLQNILHAKAIELLSGIELKSNSEILKNIVFVGLKRQIEKVNKKL